MDHRLIEQGAQAEPFVTSPLMAKRPETLAMRLNLFKARDRGITKICLHFETLVVVVNSSTYIKEIFGILQHIKAFIPRFSTIQFRYVHRSKKLIS